jgi:hypothetical protein
VAFVPGGRRGEGKRKDPAQADFIVQDIVSTLSKGQGPPAQFGADWGPWSGSLLAFASSTPTTTTQSASSPTSTSVVIQSSFTDTERERLRLMNHYTLHTSKTITEINVPEDPTVWRDWVTELAFENDFLLHGLLSLSALHLALSGVSPRKHTVVAIHQHALGIALFLPELSHITADNYDAVFAFSCVVAFYAFGIPRCPGSDHSDGLAVKDDPIAKLLQVLILLRRSSVIVKSAHDVLLQSRWSMLLLPWMSLQSATQIDLPDGMEDMLSKLLQRVQTSSTTTAPTPSSVSTQQGVYTSTIEILRVSLIFALSRPRAQLTLTLFPIITPSEFWTLVHMSEPLALAILANYAVILYWFGDNIWLHGWGKESIEGIHQALPPEWYDCIAWAIRRTELDSPWS